MRVFALIVIDLIFFLLVGPIFLAFNLRSSLLSSPHLLKKTLSECQAYSRLTSFTADDLAKLLPAEERDPQSQISTEQLQQILASIPPETLQKVAEQGLDVYYAALKDGSSSAAIDISEIKAKAFASIPPEAKAEIDKSIPNTYNLQINKTSSKIIGLLSRGWLKYAGLMTLAVFLLISLALGAGAKGKLRTVATTLVLGAIALTAFYYLMHNLPLNRLLDLTNNTASQKLIALLQDIIKGLLAPIINLFRSEYLVAYITSAILFFVSFAIPGRRAIINAAPRVPSHMSNNVSGTQLQDPRR